ncbi:hypothetical protein IWW55_004241, partial [Coemansia sp. RSA 2706]
MKLCSLAVALALGSAAQAQFAFDAENTDPALLFNDIKALWSNWAAIGNQVLASARAQYPDAYAQLTSVYGTTHLPAQFDAVPARNAAQALARSAAQLTVWDKNAGDRAQYSFEVRDVQVGAPSEASSEPTVSESTVNESTTDESTADESTADESTTDESTADESTTDESTAAESTSGESLDEPESSDNSDTSDDSDTSGASPLAAT